MRIFHIFPGVIFVLSTIVIGTHCCSSRVLLPKDREKLIVENIEEQTESASQESTTQFENIDELLPNKDYEQTIGTVESVVIDTTVLNKTEKSLLDPGSTIIPETPPIHAAEFITDPTVRAQQAGNPDYHVIDLYYSIMRDVLSFECTGQFLTDFCLNKGRCFRYPIGNYSFYSCECADGYVGERCESKSLNDFSMPSASPRTLIVLNPKILTARIVFSFPMLIALSSIYLMIAAMVVFRCPRKD